MSQTLKYRNQLRSCAIRQSRIAAMGLAFMLAASNSLAQVSTDGSLGPRQVIAGPNYTVPFTLGRQSGANVYHSFSTFNIRTNEIVTFSGGGGITNFISRVTGGSASAINGQIRTNVQGANVYLLNPFGIFFGPGASLNLTGSFYASTAGYLRFADGARFAALPFGSDESLSHTPPMGFEFSGPSGSIGLSGAQLRVSDGNTIGLIGGDLDMRNSGARVSLVSAPGGVVLLSGTGGIGMVGLDGQLHGGAPVGRITMAGGTVVNVNEGAASSLGAGKVVVRGGEVFIESSRIQAITRNGAGLGVDLEASGTLSLNSSQIHTMSFGTGRAGNIRLGAREIQIRQGSQIDASCEVGCQSRGGDIHLRADDAIRVNADASAPAFVVSNTFGRGSAGDLSIDSPLIELSGDVRIQSVTLSDGNGGNINLNARVLLAEQGAQVDVSSRNTGRGGRLNVSADSIILSGDRIDSLLGSIPSGLFAFSSGPGAGGSIFVNARNMEIRNGAEVSSKADQDSISRGGDIMINVSESLRVFGKSPLSSARSRISTSTNTRADGGNIVITAGRVIIENEGQIESRSFLEGRGGVVRIHAGEMHLSSAGQITTDVSFRGLAGSIELVIEGLLSVAGSNSGVFSNTQGNTSGGRTTIKSDSLKLLSGGAISSTAAGAGGGGQIEIRVRSLEVLEGGLVTARSGASGVGGDIALHASGTIFVSGVIEVIGLSSGNAGMIAIRADGLVEIRGGRITAAARRADGGNIELEGRAGMILTNATVETAVSSGFGSGGNVRLVAPLLLLRNAKVSANAFGGDGGNIRIVSPNVLQNTSSAVTASSELGVDGTIEFDSPAADLSGALFAVSSSFLDTAVTQGGVCAMPRLQGRASLALRVIDEDFGRAEGFLFPAMSVEPKRVPPRIALLTGAMSTSGDDRPWAR